MTDLDFSELPPAMPAATLVLFRDRDNAPPELLMVERSKGMRFAGGAVVFPGGRVDEDDHKLAALYPGLEEECAAARVAAIRETIEESGIPIGIIGTTNHDWLESARAALHDNQPFSGLLEAAGLSLDLDALIPFARWRPKHREARVFDTRFYVARAPDDLPLEVVDATENVRTFWESAQGVIDLSSEGKVKVIFPTMRNLERLALLESYADAAAHCAAFPTDMISPFHEIRDGVGHLCIPEGFGYPVTSEPLEMAVTAFYPKGQ